MKNSKRKIAVAAIALVAMIGTTAGAFAYWVHSVNGAQVEIDPGIEIGKGKEVVTSISLSALNSDLGTNKLIPYHITPKAGEANSVTYTSTIAWVTDEADFPAGTTGTLSLSLLKVYVSGDATKTDLNGATKGIASDGTAEALFSVEMTAPSPATLALQTTTGTVTPVALTLVIKMSEPATEAIYNTVQQKSLKLDINLAVAVN